MASTRLTSAATLILLALGPGERHGYAIMAEVAAATSGRVHLGPGSLYTTIARLAADGLIEECDQRPDPGLDDQRRRYWRLTPGGRAAARAEVERMAALVDRARPWATGEADA